MPRKLATIALLVSIGAPLAACGAEGDSGAGRCWHTLEKPWVPSLDASATGADVNGHYFGLGALRSGGTGLVHFDGARWETIALQSAEEGYGSWHGVWASSPDSVVAISESRVFRWEHGRVTLELDVPGLSLAAVWGSSHDDVWVAGYSIPFNCFDCAAPAKVELYHFNGLGWRHEAPGFDGQIDALWGTAFDDIWAAGSLLLHYDGKRWKQIAGGDGGPFTWLWGAAPNSIWFVSGSGAVRHYDGKAWKVVDTGGVRVTDVRGLPDGRVFAYSWKPTHQLLEWNGKAFEPADVSLPQLVAGSEARLGRYDGRLLLVAGAAYQLRGDHFDLWLEPVAPAALSGTSVPTSDPNALLAVRGKSLFTLEGTAFELVAALAGPDSDLTFYDMAAKSARDVWLGALDHSASTTRVYHWDGVALTPMQFPQSVELSFPKVARTEHGEVWIAGVEPPADAETEDQRGRVRAYRFDGSLWQDVSPDLDGVGGVAISVAGDQVWIVSGDGRIVARDGDAWIRHDVTPNGVGDLDAVAPEEAYAIAPARGKDDGPILHYDGDSWSKVSEVRDLRLRYLDGSGSELWATTWPRGSDRALVMHFDGHGWENIDAGVLEDVPIPTALRGGRAVFATDFGAWLYDCGH